MAGKYALIIGNSDYQDAGLRKLIAPMQDVESLARVLRDPNIGNFEPQNVKTLLNKSHTEINQAIELFFLDRQPDDLLLFYFSGHGEKYKDGKLCLTSVNTQPKILLSTSTTAEFLNRVMRESGAKKQLLILDCCYSGAFTLDMFKAGVEKNIGVRSYFDFRSSGKALLASSDSVQRSSDGKMVGDVVEPSVFTRVLVEGLESGDADVDGDDVITVDDLSEYVYYRVLEEAPMQEPVRSVVGKGSFAVAKSPRKLIEAERLVREKAEQERLDLRKAENKTNILRCKYCGAPLPDGYPCPYCSRDEKGLTQIERITRRVITSTSIIALLLFVCIGGGALTWQNSEKIKIALLGMTAFTPTPTYTNTLPTLAIGSTQISKIDGMTLLYVPAGSSTMGSDSGSSDEKPVHTVTLDAFWIDKFEVTNAMYALCVKVGACSAPSRTTSYTRSSYYGNAQYNNYPVIYVSWNDANKYCSWAGRRLPSEAQWEKAARGTDKRTYPWGDTAPDQNKLNYNQNVGDTTEVGKYPSGASFYGTMDMAGNVWEWVNDWYDETYYSKSVSSNPTGPISGTSRVLRGGAWSNVGNDVRASNRNWYDPSNVDYIVGFRCALSP